MLKQLSVLICISLCVCLIYSSPGCSQTDQGQPPEVIISESLQDSSSIQPEPKLIVYYFHGRKRCMSCRTIEGYTNDAIQTYFGEQLENGRLEWLVRNYVNPEYAHFKDDFQLYTQSVVLVDMNGDQMVRWKNLNEVWTLLRNKNAYYDYIRREVEAFLIEE